MMIMMMVAMQMGDNWPPTILVWNRFAFVPHSDHYDFHLFHTLIMIIKMIVMMIMMMIAMQMGDNWL